MLAPLILLALVPVMEASGCWFWITPIGKGATPFAKYMSCTGLSSYKDCGSVECTDEGWPKQGCSEIDEATYNCLLAKEEPTSYAYLTTADACPGLPAPKPAPVAPAGNGGGPKPSGNGDAIMPPGTEPTGNEIVDLSGTDGGASVVSPVDATEVKPAGETVDVVPSGYGRFRRFRKLRKN